MTQGRNLGGVGSLERGNATFRSGNTLWCRFGPDSRESGSKNKHVSGSSDDGRSVDLEGKAPGRMKTRRATASAQNSKQWC